MVANKQLEEMAKIIEEATRQGYQRIMEETRNFVQKNHRYHSMADYDKAHPQTIDEIIAEALYKEGYCKVDETEKMKIYKEAYEQGRFDVNAEIAVDEKVVIDKGFFDDLIAGNVTRYIKETDNIIISKKEYENSHKETAREVLQEVADLLYELGVNETKTTFAVCELAYHKVIRKLAEKHGVEVE